ncbi:hypothetical protein D9758_009326 [Tetrapyrgos nigripes]|uniref:Uncharacterized protein n=1 Tax=Tetrapyrgos nigripes TaxID=182062 RepID=A0A8H5GHB8_9AGAR|nr:hypothetical protein D9758_009326 [Tetrapyrgos nigripes]
MDVAIDGQVTTVGYPTYRASPSSTEKSEPNPITRRALHHRTKEWMSLISICTKPLDPPSFISLLMRIDHRSSSMNRTTLIGTWLNLMLFALVIDRALYYFCHYHTDRIFVKIVVFAALACDTAATIAECADIYFIQERGIHVAQILVLPQGEVLRAQILPAVILWLSTAMVADLLIALLLVLYYRVTDRDRTLRSSSNWQIL